MDDQTEWNQPDEDVRRIMEEFAIPQSRARKWNDYIGPVDQIREEIGRNAHERGRYIHLITERDRLIGQKREIRSNFLAPVREWVRSKYSHDPLDIQAADERIAEENRVAGIVEDEALSRHSPWEQIETQLRGVEEQLESIYFSYLDELDRVDESKKSKIIELKRAFPYLRASDIFLGEMLNTTKSYAGQFREMEGEGVTDRTASKKLKNRARERDDHECVRCGSSKEIEVHHIIPRARGGNNDLSNVAVLCRECHLKAHGTLSAFDPDNRPEVSQGTIYDDHDGFWTWVDEGKR